MSVQIVASAQQVDAELWQNAFSADCLDHRYYEIVEEAFREQYDFRYAILTNESTGKSVVQPFFFVDQEITAGLPERFRPAWISRLLKLKMAVIGCAVGEGRLDCNEPWALEALAQAVERCAREAHARIVLFKDFPAEYRAVFARLEQCGYKRVPSMPAARLELPFTSFDQYLQRKLGRGFRSNLRRKLRDSERLGRLTLEVVHDAAPYLDEIYPLYLETYTRSPFRFEKLNTDYFSLLGRRMPERTRFFLWRREERLLAFALCFVHQGVLHYLNIGMNYKEALDRHLYYVVWRDLVSWAIDARLTRIETGPLNYEAKFRLGFRLAARDLYARHTSAFLNPLFSFALRFLQPARHDPALRKFPNAGEL